MSTRNCAHCGRDTTSATGVCHHCMPHGTTRTENAGRSRGRKQLSTKKQWLDRNEIPFFDPIDPEADKDKEWDEFELD